MAVLKTLGANPQMINALSEAQRLSQRYGNSREGMLKAVQENGGIPALDEAMKYIDNPLVVTALNRIGVNASELKVLANSLKGTTPVQNREPLKDNVVDDLQQRLNRLKL